MKYLHFFWDFDGTLYDTYGRIARAAQKALRDLGQEAELDAIYRMIKRSLHFLWAELLLPLGVEEKAFSAAYHAHAEEEGPESIRPYPGVREMLEAVAAGGGKNYLYTHRGLDALACLQRDGFSALFADAVTSADGFPLKPAPDALNHLVEKHGLDRRRCIMLGDRDIDLDAGKNAGIDGALFDPENFYPDYATPYRFADMPALRRALTEDGADEPPA